MKSLWIVLLSICSLHSAFGQENISSKGSNPLKIGVHTQVRMSQFSNDTKLEEHGFTFSGIPDIGVSVYYPLHKKNAVGLTADITLANYQNTYTATAGTVKTDFTRTFNYLMIVPGINFENITLGIGIGVPMGYHRHNNTMNLEEYDSWNVPNDTSKPIKDRGVDEYVNILIEPRVGYSYPIKISQNSQLHINAQVGLMLSNVFKDDFFPTSNLQSYNGTMVSASLGIQYMFAL